MNCYLTAYLIYGYIIFFFFLKNNVITYSLVKEIK